MKNQREIKDEYSCRFRSVRRFVREIWEAQIGGPEANKKICHQFCFKMPVVVFWRLINIDMSTYSHTRTVKIAKSQRIRAWLPGEFHPGLKFPPGFWNKSSKNQIVDSMGRDSARAENRSPVFSNRAMIFRIWESEKVSCNRNGISARAEKGTRACALTVFSRLSKLSHGNLPFAPGLKLSM